MTVEINNRVEYALSKPYPTRHDLETHCREAREEGYRAISIPSSLITFACELLDGSDIKISCVIGVPFGSSDPDVKRYETEVATDLGAHEIELVPALSRLLDGDQKSVLREIRDVVEAADERPVKVSLELDLWTPGQLPGIVGTILDSGAQFISTGVAPRARQITKPEIENLRTLTGSEFGLKINAGRSISELSDFVNVGVERFALFSPA